ncbi:hypothetical protein Bhyg_15231, partial [Pseudolycoriella hygida]
MITTIEKFKRTDILTMLMSILLKELPDNKKLPPINSLNGATTASNSNERPKNFLTTRTTTTPSTMGENSLSSVEEVISIDDCAAGSSYSTIPF